MPTPKFLILGCGYTGKRVARRLIDSGFEVICTNRQRGSVEGAECLELDAADAASMAQLEGRLPTGLRVLHSIPLISGDGKVGPERSIECTPQLTSMLRARGALRVLYLSTTGVYGNQEVIDEATLEAPNTPHAEARVAAERLVAMGPWSSLILRPAAIYGPGRGVHAAIRGGTFRPEGTAQRVVSRIHVDDLAEIVTASLQSDLSGTYPVADEDACPSLDVAQLTASLLNLTPVTPSTVNSSTGDERKGRRVDGSAILRRLALRLMYPSYRVGIPACLAAET